VKNPCVVNVIKSSNQVGSAPIVIVNATLVIASWERTSIAVDAGHLMLLATNIFENPSPTINTTQHYYHLIINYPPVFITAMAVYLSYLLLLVHPDKNLYTLTNKVSLFFLLSTWFFCNIFFFFFIKKKKLDIFVYFG
jgi:hypothetical protein